MTTKLVKELPFSEQDTLSCNFCTRKEDDESLLGKFYRVHQQQYHSPLQLPPLCLRFGAEGWRGWRNLWIPWCRHFKGSEEGQKTQMFQMPCNWSHHWLQQHHLQEELPLSLWFWDWNAQPVLWFLQILLCQPQAHPEGFKVLFADSAGNLHHLPRRSGCQTE